MFRFFSGSTETPSVAGFQSEEARSVDSSSVVSERRYSTVATPERSSEVARRYFRVSLKKSPNVMLFKKLVQESSSELISPEGATESFFTSAETTSLSRPAAETALNSKVFELVSSVILRVEE